MNRNNPVDHQEPTGFGVTVEAAVEKRCYPAHARNQVGHVPQPRYAIQSQFNETNPSFKGYGIAYIRPSTGSVFPVENDCAAQQKVQQRGRVKGVDLAEMGIDKEKFAFGTSSKRGSESVQTCLFGQSYAPVSAQRIRPVSGGTPCAPETRQDAAGATTRSSIAVKDLMNYETSSPFPPTVAPDVRPSTELATSQPSLSARVSAERNRRHVSHIAHEAVPLFRQEKSPLDVKTILQRCGPLFHNVVNNPNLFKKVWVHGGGGVDRETLTFEKFREAMEDLGL